MSTSPYDSQYTEDSDFEFDVSCPMGKLMPISENLDADDESDSSELESDTGGNESHKRTRQGSLSLTHVVTQDKIRPHYRQRKLSCIELISNNKKNEIDGMFNKSVELPSIKRSMSLPECFEDFQMKHVAKGSKSAAGRLRLPDIGKNESSPFNNHNHCDTKKPYFFLPNLVKNANMDVQNINKTEIKKLDLFMRNKFR